MPKRTPIGYGGSPTLPFILSSNFAEFNRPPPPFNRRGRRRGRRAPPYPTTAADNRALHSFLKMRPEDGRRKERATPITGASWRQTPLPGGEPEEARARPEEDASVRPGQQRASGFKVKRGAALWLPGQRRGPGGRTEGTGVISTHGNCGGGCGGGEKVKKSRLSEQSSGGEEKSSAVNRVSSHLSCFQNHSYIRIQQQSDTSFI